MTITRRSANVLVAGALSLAVVAAGVVGYNAKIKADAITPGYATAKVIMNVTVPQQTEMSANATFVPTDIKTEKYYFKNRVFTLKPGVNLVSWYVKKIPGGNYNLIVTSDIGTFSPSSASISLTNDKIKNSDKFTLDLGMPEVNQTEQSTSSGVTATAASTATAGTPPIPSLDSETAEATATEKVPAESIPSLPTI